MGLLLSQGAWLTAVLIFFLRVGDMALDTIRVLFVVRGKKGLAWVLGVCQSLIYVVAISSVLANLDNPLNIVGYATGFATGNVVGMMIESRLAIGHIRLIIISPSKGKEIASQLREVGYAVTELAGRGKSGKVALLHMDMLRKDVDQVERIIQKCDEDAFVTAEDVRPVRRGFWRA